MTGQHMRAKWLLLIALAIALAMLLMGCVTTNDHVHIENVNVITEIRHESQDTKLPASQRPTLHRQRYRHLDEALEPETTL